MIHTIDRPHVFCHVCGRDGRVLAVLTLNFAADGRVAEDAGRMAFVCGGCLDEAHRAVRSVSPDPTVVDGQWWCSHVGGLGPPFPYCDVCSKGQPR